MEDKPIFTSEEEKRIREIVLSILHEQYLKIYTNITHAAIESLTSAPDKTIVIGDHIHHGV